MLFWIFPLKKLLPLRVFPNSEILFKSVVFICNKWLQIAPLLIIFVDILPKVRAVPFAEILYKQCCCCCPWKSGFKILSKLSTCANLFLIGKESSFRAMAAKDWIWIVHKNVIENRGFFRVTIAKAIEVYNRIIQWSNFHHLKQLYPRNFIFAAISFMTTAPRRFIVKNHKITVESWNWKTMTPRITAEYWKTRTSSIFFRNPK